MLLAHHDQLQEDTLKNADKELGEVGADQSSMMNDGDSSMNEINTKRGVEH